MAEFEYGPVDLYLVGFEGERPDQGTLDAITDLVEDGAVRLLDFLVVSKSAEGDVTFVEIEDLGDEIVIDEGALGASGIVGDEDVAEFADLIPAGTSAALVALELVWMKKLASRFVESGATLLQAERIPAPVVNAVIAEAEAEGE